MVPSCLIAGGGNWKLSASRILQQQLVPIQPPSEESIPEGEFWERFIGTFDESPGLDLYEAAWALCHELLLSEDQKGGRKDIVDTHRSIVYLLALATDIRFIVFKHRQPTIVPISVSDYRFVSTMKDTQFLAIPACLAGQECTVARAWVLEPRSEQRIV